MKSSVIVSCLVVFTSITLLAGCGLAETSAVAAAEGASAAEQVKQGKEMEAKVQRDIDAAQKKAADQLAAADKQSE